MTPEEREAIKRQFVFLDSIEEDQQPWYWRGWIPLGAVTIMGGTPGTSKSTVLSRIAAAATSDRLMPDGTLCEAMGGVVWISYEESAAYRLAPRFREQGGDKTQFIDLSLVHRTVKHPGQASYTPFAVPDDLRGRGGLKDAIRACGATLVVIDPLMSMAAANKRIHGNQAARECVGELQLLAQETGVAVVIINHFTKGNLKDPMRSMAGSQGFIDFVRSVIMVTKDEANEDHCIMSLIKHSNSGDAPQVVFENLDGSHIKFIEGLTPEQEEARKKELAKTNEQKILELLNEFPMRAFNPSKVAQELDIPYDTTKSLLRRMAMKGTILNEAYGTYKAKASRRKQSA